MGRQNIKFHLYHSIASSYEKVQFLGFDESRFESLSPGRDFEPYHPESIASPRHRDNLNDTTVNQDPLVGTAVVELDAFLRGSVGDIHGWYHLVDQQQRRIGQIKVKVSRCSFEASGKERIDPTVRATFDSETSLLSRHDLAKSMKSLDDVRGGLLKRLGGQNVNVSSMTL